MKQVGGAAQLAIDNHHAPENGPKLLFFSGGSALTQISEALTAYTHNSIHVITAFDSGGSSAELRRHFDLPALGDIRSRMIALANIAKPEVVAVRQLLKYRFTRCAAEQDIEQEFNMLMKGQHRLFSGIGSNTHQQICAALASFQAHKTADFCLQGASIGNLALAGLCLQFDKDVERAIQIFSNWLDVLGDVRLVTTQSFHLAAELDNGKQVLGQHAITGKESKPINSPICTLSLSTSGDSLKQVQPSADASLLQQIREADLICFSPGSFYSSLIATLLPKGIGTAIAESNAAKVYIPSLGNDPEQFGLGRDQTIATLIKYLQADAGNVDVSRLLNYCCIADQLSPSERIALLAGTEKYGVNTIDCYADTNNQYVAQSLSENIIQLAI